MGAVYHNGDYFAGALGIDDTQATDKNTWSSEKITAYTAEEIAKEAKYTRNATRRTRKNITSDIQADNGAKLIKAAAEQDLAKYGYAIGDYFVGASGQYYNLADMDCNYGGFNNQATVSTHHIGIVVDSKATSAWLSSGTVTNYSSSTLHSFLASTVLNNVKSDFKTLFGGSTGAEHLLARTELDNAIGGWGTTWTGLASCLICALTEVQVYAARIFGADGFQTGTGNKQLEIFRKFKYTEIFGNMWVWLKSLNSASYACYASNGGFAHNAGFSHTGRAAGLILFH